MEAWDECGILQFLFVDKTQIDRAEDLTELYVIHVPV